MSRKTLKIIFQRLLTCFTCVFCSYSVYSVAQAGEKVSLGTGWLGASDIVVTNYHVIAGFENINLINHKKQLVTAKLLKFDILSDLALLQINETTEISPLLLTLKNARMGEQVFTMGFPHINIMGLSPKLTTGIINAKSGVADDPRTYQISVPLQSGNSGGPLMNMQGEVIGITTSKLSAEKMFNWTGDVPQNVNYAVKHNYLSSLIDSLERDQPLAQTKKVEHQKLATLAGRVEKSIFIVVAHQGEFSNDLLKQAKTENDFPLNNGINYSISLFTYAEPGSYDIKSDDKESNTVARYSKNFSDMMESQILLKTNNKIAVSHNIMGMRAKTSVVNSLKKEHNRKLCADNGDDILLFGLSEANPNAHFRYATYSMFDCHKNELYKKDYTIEREEFYDKFSYEHQLRSSLNRFIRDIPPYIRWVN